MLGLFPRGHLHFSLSNSYSFVLFGQGLHRRRGRSAAVIRGVGSSHWRSGLGGPPASCLLQLLVKNLGVLEQSAQVDLHNRVRWDVGCFVLEATVHEDRLVNGPDGVSEPLQRLELPPLRALRLIHLQLDILSHRVRPTAKHYHQRPDENSRMLVSCEGFFSLRLVRGFDPVPPAISVSSQSPRVLQSALVRSSAAKDDHHSSCGSCRAQSCRMVYSNAGLFSRGF